MNRRIDEPSSNGLRVFGSATVVSVLAKVILDALYVDVIRTEFQRGGRLPLSGEALRCLHEFATRHGMRDPTSPLRMSGTLESGAGPS